MKVLVTGGAGFIGSHLCERLLERGNELVVLDNFNNFYDPRIKARNLERVREKGRFSLYSKDLLDGDSLDMLFRDERPTAVVHLAAYAGVRPSLADPMLYDQVNVTGTSALLEKCRRYDVDRFVFGSSSSVYGVNSKVPFHEDDPINQPISPYAVTKRAGELLCFSHHHTYGLPISCLRFFTVYGPRQRPEMAIHKFTRQIHRGDPIQVYDEGKSERDYTFVDDIVAGLLASLERVEGFQIFNLGNCRTVALLRLINLVEEALGRKAQLQLLPAQPGDVPITFADISRASQELGYAPSTPIEVGVPRFVEWYLKEMAD